MNLNINSTGSNGSLVWPLILVGVVGLSGYAGVQLAKKFNTTEHRSTVVFAATWDAKGNLKCEPVKTTITKGSIINETGANTVGAVAGAIWGALTLAGVRQAMSR